MQRGTCSIGIGQSCPVKPSNYRAVSISDDPSSGKVGKVQLSSPKTGGGSLVGLHRFVSNLANPDFPEIYKREINIQYYYIPTYIYLVVIWLVPSTFALAALTALALGKPLPSLLASADVSPSFVLSCMCPCLCNKSSTILSTAPYPDIFGPLIL